MSDKFMIIPLEVAHDKDLPPNAKLLYGEILSLSQKTGECFASNAYLSNQLNIGVSSVARLLKNLIDKGFVESEIKYKNHSKIIEKRVLSISRRPPIKNQNTYTQNCNNPLSKMQDPIIKNENTPYQKREDPLSKMQDPIIKNENTPYQKREDPLSKLQDPPIKNDKDNNSTINSISIISTSTVPTKYEIENYIQEKGYSFSADKFFETYEKKEWKYGGKIMDWKSSADYWEETQRKEETQDELAYELEAIHRRRNVIGTNEVENDSKEFNEQSDF